VPSSGQLRVLVVARREPWPLNSGGRLRLYNFLKCLARDASVTLALPEEPRSPEHLPDSLRVLNIGAPPERERPRLRPHVPWIAGAARRHFGYSPAVCGWLETHARPERFDVALLYGAVAGQYIDVVSVPAVWDAVDELVLYTVRDRVQHWPRRARAALLYALFERHAGRKAYATIFASGVDASYARRWMGDARVEAVSNGVDCDYFSGPSQPGELGTLAFVGSLSFPPNIDGIVRFTTRIWPRVRNGFSGRRLLIVGREPAAAVRDLRRLPGVTVHADVPDVRPYLSQAAIVVVPTHLGGGVKNKVLEACAMRRAVVASPRALAGLSAQPGSDLLCAQSEADWVRHTSRLLNDANLAARIAASGYRWVRRAHDWPQLAGRVQQILADAAGRRAKARSHRGACDVQSEGPPCPRYSQVRRRCVPAAL
jgi:glycosyltransferase involved in cell wall biosynthesis